MQDFRSLQVWPKGHQLTLAVYGAKASFPREELYGLTSQIRRSCASIPANIAEGCGRTGKAELARFLQVSWVRPANSNTIFYWPTIWGF
jgi:four helix bundle protein